MVNKCIWMGIIPLGAERLLVGFFSDYFIGGCSTENKSPIWDEEKVSSCLQAAKEQAEPCSPQRKGKTNPGIVLMSELQSSKI